MIKLSDIPIELDRRPFVWSYSSLSCYLDVCPRQFWHRYVARDIVFEETPEIKHGNEVHLGLERYIAVDKRPTNPMIVTWAERFAAPLRQRGALAEEKLGITRENTTCDFWAQGVWGRCKIDAMIVSGNNGYICDWKTGGSKYESPFELEIQAMMLQARYAGSLNIVGQYVWLKENRLGQLYNLSDYTKTWEKCKATAKQIDMKIGFVRERETRLDEEFPKRKGPLCGYCPVNTCEHWHDKRK